jgi:hypothetical protein
MGYNPVGVSFGKEWTMTYRGHAKSGVVVLDGEVALPEGAAVRVELADAQPRTLAERLEGVIGIVDGPPDLATHHDHYAHGKPKP